VSTYQYLIKIAESDRKMTIPCRPLTLSGVSGVVKAALLKFRQAHMDLVSKDSMTLNEHYAKWRGATMLMSMKASELGLNKNLATGPESLSSGTGSFSLLGLFPLMGAVGQQAYKSTVLGAPPKSYTVDGIIDHLKSFSMIHLPLLNGINPMRKTHMIMGTRSVFLKSFIFMMNK